MFFFVSSPLFHVSWFTQSYYVLKYKDKLSAIIKQSFTKIQPKLKI